MKRLVTVVMLSVSMAVLASGCLWGFVTDADTGAPIPGATVRYTDAEGHTGSSTTNADGLYAFDIASGPVPAAGAVNMEVSAPGYEPITVPRLVEYDDNPDATGDNLSSFWEVQHFDLLPERERRVEVELLSIDVNSAVLAAGPYVVGTRYNFQFVARDFLDPTVTGCRAISEWFDIYSPDPPPQTLDGSLPCQIASDRLGVTVTVTLERRWHSLVPPDPYRVQTDISTAAFQWIAPSPETPWQSETLDSADVYGPDSGDLRFTAELRYRSVALP